VIVLCLRTARKALPVSSSMGRYQLVLSNTAIVALAINVTILVAAPYSLVRMTPELSSFRADQYLLRSSALLDVTQPLGRLQIESYDTSEAGINLRWRPPLALCDAVIPLQQGPARCFHSTRLRGGRRNVVDTELNVRAAVGQKTLTTSRKRFRLSGSTRLARLAN